MRRASKLVFSVIILFVSLVVKASVPVDALVPLDISFVPCSGTYALCYYAKCKNNGDGTAECGCAVFKGSDKLSFVSVNNINPQSLQDTTREKCPNGLASCPFGEAPICDVMSTKLLSTFNTGEPQFNYLGDMQCSSGAYANCMTAECEEKTAFDGSPVTCACRVETAAYAMAKSTSGSCTLSDGMIWSAKPIPGS